MRLGAPRVAVDPAALRPMKPETAERPFNRAGWVFELKYDGFRMLAAGGAGESRLFYKSGHDATRIFPELGAAIAGLPFRGLILDGEAVVLDGEGRPDFQRLQKRGLRVRLADVQHAAAASPATLFVFDLLGFEDFDLRPLPLAARKEILRRVLPPGGDWIRLTEEIPERGEDLYAAVAGMGLEGIVAKRAGSPYRSGYAKDWLKVRVDQSSDFAVVGFEPVAGGRTGLRRLHLATVDGGGLAYAGAVGTGFNREVEGEIRARLDPLRRATPPLAMADVRGTVWVEPEVVVEVRYKEWTDGGHLRHPVFLRLRDDKTAGECFRPGEEREEEEAEDGAAGEKSRQAHQSRQGFLAGGGDHQGGSDRILPRGLPLAAPAPALAPADARPLSERHHRQVVLPAERAGGRRGGAAGAGESRRDPVPHRSQPAGELRTIRTGASWTSIRRRRRSPTW